MTSLIIAAVFSMLPCSVPEMPCVLPIDTTRRLTWATTGDADWWTVCKKARRLPPMRCRDVTAPEANFSVYWPHGMRPGRKDCFIVIAHNAHGSTRSGERLCVIWRAAP